MTFQYEDYFDAAPSTGYETLIYDCMIGDAILFQRADGIEAGWRAVQPFLDAWRKAGSNGLAIYRAGTEGPPEADQLLARSIEATKLAATPKLSKQARDAFASADRPAAPSGTYAVPDRHSSNF